MATGMLYLNYLAERGVLSANKRILDIGTQNLYNATVPEMKAFIARFPRPDADLSVLDSFARRSLVPSPEPNVVTLYLSELLALTSMEYESFDVAAGVKTRIFDLNRESLPPTDHAHYDTVLNFGTTEHVFDQVNSFRVIHQATKPLGYMFHQLPGSGYLDHCYFSYNRRFFTELAEANRYEVLDVWYAGPQAVQTLYEVNPDLEEKDATRSMVDIEAWKRYPIANSIINVLFRKTHADPMRLPLEVSTTHSAVDRRVHEQYGADAPKLASLEAVPAVQRSFFQRLFRR